MNYATVIQALKPLNELRKLKLPYIKAKEVYRISKLFEGEFAFFQQEENKLIGEYATKDDKGNPKTENGVITFDSIEDKMKYLEEIKKLSDTEIDTELPRVVLTGDDIGEQTVSPETLEKLENIIIFE